jgi:hypothetical protein
MASFFESVGKKVKQTIEAVDNAGNKLGRDLNVPGARESHEAEISHKINSGDMKTYKKHRGKI